MPAQDLGEDSAGQQADRRTRGTDEAVNADGPGSFAAAGNNPTIMPRITDEAIAPPIPWRNLAAISISGPTASAAECRSHGEDQHTGKEDLPPADQVADPAR